MNIDGLCYPSFAPTIVPKLQIVNRIMVSSDQIECLFMRIYIEHSACTNPLWPSRLMKYVQKFERTCYIRITEILRYERAEQICRRYGLQLAVIDNIRLLERLKQLTMWKRNLTRLFKKIGSLFS